DKWYTQLRLGNHNLIRETYLQHLFLYNELSKFESNGIRFQGTITGVNPDGRLVMLKEDETTILFSYKEMKYLF
ncbi:MAG: biotin--[acetyl-CoA-carboxylase] ligase, partial [Bacteroidota bacterium]|nr:biotin--[acetyl-CoA-carboxylase] ligase [Bacteroidota bacterium]